eukprot:jgi/Picsp_1/6236/NSC_03590-R1_protein
MMKSKEILGRKKSAYCYTAMAAGSVVALATSYAAYESYRRDVHGKSARYIKSVWKSAQQYLEAFSIGGEICRRVARDVESYLLTHEEDVGAGEGGTGGNSTVTDSKSVSAAVRGDEKIGVIINNVCGGKGEDDVPRSLQRLARLVQSEEFCETVASTVGAVCTGVGRAQIAQVETEMDDGEKKFWTGEQSGGVLGQVLEALLSERGQSLVSVAVSMGARSMVSAYVESQKKTQTIRKSGGEVQPEENSNSADGAGDAVLEFLSRPGGQRLAVMCISACANSAMKAYMEETIDINYYDQMLSSISKPKHLDVVKECIALFVKVAVTSFKSGSGALPPDVGNHEAEFGIDGEVLFDEKDTTAQMLQPDTAIHSPCSAVVSHEDEVDSDYMMQYSSRKTTRKEDKEKFPGFRTSGRRTSQGTGVQAGQGHSDYGLVSAIGREWIAVSQDPESQRAIVSIVGCATREAVGAVADTIADRLQWTSFVVVLLFGILSAMCLQLLLRVVGLA